MKKTIKGLALSQAKWGKFFKTRVSSDARRERRCVAETHFGSRCLRPVPGIVHRCWQHQETPTHHSCLPRPAPSRMVGLAAAGAVGGWMRKKTP